MYLFEIAFFVLKLHWHYDFVDHIFELNQSRVLLVCLTLFLCEAKWHLLLDLLFVFCTKKKLAKENRRLESKCFFTQVTSSTEIVQLSAQSSSWCPCQKTARKMTKRPKKATAASMVTTIYYSDGFWQWSFLVFRLGSLWTSSKKNIAEVVHNLSLGFRAKFCRMVKSGYGILRLCGYVPGTITSKNSVGCGLIFWGYLWCSPGLLQLFRLLALHTTTR